MSQKSLKQSVKFSGVGAHSGINANVEVCPAPCGHGIKFHRTDIDQIIDADYKNVADTSLCTVIANADGAKVSTIEHLMSALYGFGIDNALIKIDSSEMPILDGSSKLYTAAIKNAGVLSYNKPKQYIEVLKEVTVQVEDKWITLSPADCFSVEATIEYNHPLIKKQSYRYNGVNNYENDIAEARTFGFIKDVENLRKAGLAKGSSLENAIALTDDGMLNKNLRFNDEFIRHKLLDCMGDLYLAGNLIAAVSGHKIGHMMNNLILHKLFSNSENYRLVTK